MRRRCVPMSMRKKRRQAQDTEAAFRRRRSGPKQTLLVLVNLFLILDMVAIAVIYSRTVLAQRNQMRRDSFCTMTESMKKVSENYLNTEKGYVDDWAAYISARHMTAEEALDYIRTTNTHTDRAAHLVDLDDLSAQSTVLRNGNPWVHCYEEMREVDTIAGTSSINKMTRMLQEDSGKVLVLGKYRVGEAQRTVISVGAQVTIRLADGSDKDYLLLRVIPVEYLQEAWVFPTEYPAAEISLIARDGGYVVQSPALRSSNFLEFIRAYNFQDDYNRVYDLAETLRTSDTGLLEYRNSAGEDCYFYYSALGEDADVCILGYVPVAQVLSGATDWSIVNMICGTLLLLSLIDGCHLLSINRALRRAVAAAEKASQAKTQFLSTMSHDIRTPMNAVLGMTEVAKLHVDDPAFVRSCLDKVTMSGRHLLTLINDILDISKVESGKMSLSPRPFSLRAAAEEIGEMIGQSCQNKNIAFTMHIQEPVCDTVVADALRLRQVLLNLLTNAVKYTDPGGSVSFSVSQRPGSEPDSTVLQFVVADNGMGMSDSFQKTMYTSFARATDSRINTIQGSGLGLAIAKQMVELMNGSIVCESALGKGTTFTVTLQVPTASDLPQESRPEGGAPRLADSLKDMRVLVAEDNELNWQIISALLQEYGVRADRAVNGVDCLNRLHDPAAPRYDLVLMDVQMPEMDGRTATRHIRRSTDDYVRSLPVVAMTADAFAEDIHACLEAGMDGHISKPVEMSQVLQFLKEAKNGTLH